MCVAGQPERVLGVVQKRPSLTGRITSANASRLLFLVM
jgi:hypothetical protein